METKIIKLKPCDCIVSALAVVLLKMGRLFDRLYCRIGDYLMLKYVGKDMFVLVDDVETRLTEIRLINYYELDD